MRKSLLFCTTVLLPLLVESGNPPATMAQLECSVAQFALAYGTSKLPPYSSSASSIQALHDALNIDYLCNTSTYSVFDLDRGTDEISQRIRNGIANERFRIQKERDTFRSTVLPTDPTNIFYVSPSGNDSNSGTSPSSPFLTLQRAQQAYQSITPPRAPGSTIVYLRGGIYYLGNNPLLLTENDNNVVWQAYPADLAVGMTVTLSGAMLLPPLNWNPFSNNTNIYVANITIPDPRREIWYYNHPNWTGAGPPPKVASLFIDNMRQVRARFPNGNPQTGALCFSSTQRPGEGCTYYSGCVTSGTGSFPSPPGTPINNVSPNRGNSPTWGCPQCGNHYGQFQYTIYPYPENHPVYTDPLYGMGFNNNSLFSFWGSPFSRPNGINVNAGSTCDNGHWDIVNSYTNPQDAVVHMFHSGLWGGHMYAVNSVSSGGPPPLPMDSNTGEVTLPSGMALWLRADDIPTNQDNQPLTTWTDASGNHADAGQNDPSLQPIYKAKGFPNSMPCVSFNGSTYLFNGNSPNFNSQSTVFAVMIDNGSNTDYGSGVFMSRGGLNGLGTRVNTATTGTDDDPSPVGTTIRSLMVDWPGSPADPGHRDLSTRANILSVVYENAGTFGFVNGCIELTEPQGQGQSGTGFDIGTRNAEMGRYLVGDIAEIIVFNRPLNITERQQVNQYLQNKWSIVNPKHCAQPSSDAVTINFGYGGYQEARGCGVNAGQHFYIENVLEELDVPGEWYYDLHQNLLYVWPNVTGNGGAYLSSATLSIPMEDQIILINGSQTAWNSYVTNVSFIDFIITGSRVTFLEPYEVPSGGDWSVARKGAVYVQNAENINIVNCTFNQTGGNGVIFSNHVQSSVIADSEFVYIGDSAIIFLGSTTGVDGTGPTYPNQNTIARNHIHEVGIYGKQTSCFGQQLSANTTMVDSICYNGPRAGINWNDGFGGSHYVARNLVFNAVRETGDHGPFNR